MFLIAAFLLLACTYSNESMSKVNIISDTRVYAELDSTSETLMEDPTSFEKDEKMVERGTMESEMTQVADSKGSIKVENSIQQPNEVTDNRTAEASSADGSLEDTHEHLVSDEYQEIQEMVVEAPFTGIHDTWDDLLKTYVSATGFVDYTGLRNEKNRLEQYLESISSAEPKTLDRDERMAFWINAYNAFTVKLILDNYPLRSIMDLDNGKVWDRKWIIIAGELRSLNDIEHNILRKEFKDARIHFAVNCAATSCPPLNDHAWTGDNLKSTLDKKAREFINNPRYNELTHKELKLSKIFEWYATDFGNINSYIKKYAQKEFSVNAKVTYLEYDWSLNGK